MTQKRADRLVASDLRGRAWSVSPGYFFQPLYIFIPWGKNRSQIKTEELFLFFKMFLALVA